MDSHKDQPALPVEAAVLRVSGARLYYERRGSGPLLALAPAGAGDADSYRALAEQMAGRYTVLTYDRRGYSRSTVDDPERPIGIADHREDLHGLLAALGEAPAAVFGGSIGAIIGLDLVCHHGGQVRALVAHEPPLLALLRAAERDQARREHQAVRATLGHAGGEAALRQLAGNLGVRHPDGAPPQDGAYAAGNAITFLKHDAGAVARYTLDAAALRAAPTRIVVAGGTDGRAYAPYRAAAALAELLGLALVEFPGNHAGFVSQPQAFATRLMAVLERAMAA